MLVELRLENYAVIDNVAVEFAPGLNLLTGETGAGKSILIDALALLLGRLSHRIGEAELSRLALMLVTKLRSILMMSNGSDLRCASDEKPVACRQSYSSQSVLLMSIAFLDYYFSMIIHKQFGAPRRDGPAGPGTRPRCPPRSRPVPGRR